MFRVVDDSEDALDPVRSYFSLALPDDIITCPQWWVRCDTIRATNSLYQLLQRYRLPPDIGPEAKRRYWSGVWSQLNLDVGRCYEDT